MLKRQNVRKEKAEYIAPDIKVFSSYLRGGVLAASADGELETMIEFDLFED